MIDRLPPRMRSKINVDESGCWLWTGALTSRGYASAGINSRIVSVHRYLYELLIEPIPPGLQIDHLCRIRHCVNPVHLEPVTQRENQARSPLTPLGKTHCKRGHPLSGPNLYQHPRGNRVCRACANDSNAWRRIINAATRPRDAAGIVS